jgi:hypothetical protein
MPFSPLTGCSVWQQPTARPVNPHEGKTINRRAGCGRTACPVRRGGSPNPIGLPYPYPHHQLAMENRWPNSDRTHMMKHLVAPRSSHAGWTTLRRMISSHGTSRRPTSTGATLNGASRRTLLACRRLSAGFLTGENRGSRDGYRILTLLSLFSPVQKTLVTQPVPSFASAMQPAHPSSTHTDKLNEPGGPVGKANAKSNKICHVQLLRLTRYFNGLLSESSRQKLPTVHVSPVVLSVAVIVGIPALWAGESSQQAGIIHRTQCSVDGRGVDTSFVVAT